MTTYTLSRKKHAIFVAATLLYWTTMYIYVPILTPFLKDRGISLSLIGLIVGSYGLTQVLIRFPLGIYSDRMRRRKPFMVVGMLAGLASCGLFLLGNSWGTPLAGRLVAGICASAWVPFTVLYASYYPPAKSTQAMATLSFLTVLGQLFGMTASGWIAGSGGWDAAFLTGIGLAALGTVAALGIEERAPALSASVPAPTAKPRKTAPHERSSTGSNRRIRDLLSLIGSSPLLIEVSILSMLGHCILFITMFGFTPLQAVELGASASELTWLVVAFMVPHALISLWNGRYIAPRLGARRTILCGFALSAICTAIIPLCPSLPWLYATQAINGIGQALYIPLLLGLAIQDFAPEHRATAMGFYQSVYSIGMFLGPYLAGWLNGIGGLEAGFFFGASLGLVAAAIVTIRGQRQKRAIAKSAVAADETPNTLST
ncbi:MFS transporter [Cohnella sp. AR92]|uniref:MFS transporter n=1 Tax=Cohnella sp. AR92 TaxID=648716 RepID=UPI000F8C67E8|nr:MFS transporter [Cohnella sp. AR92]RUS48253.1 MFS transporter [Cohnella sp. AR92]